jgi:hypothetical protein
MWVKKKLSHKPLVKRGSRATSCFVLKRIMILEKWTMHHTYRLYTQQNISLQERAEQRQRRLLEKSGTELKLHWYPNALRLRFRMTSMSEAVGHCDGAESTAFQPPRCKPLVMTRHSGPEAVDAGMVDSSC